MRWLAAAAHQRLWPGAKTEQKDLPMDIKKIAIGDNPPESLNVIIEVRWAASR